ncbi:acylneuraminate cytidylyltransferase family protein [Lysinibacillus sp. FSL M8-0216]|uniref:acylneuraminate cytidylyltransferase family protein n=1 Tax=Lysinibacillus sp. FSL M8-0216 TaxID=2921619 RepID=UPI00315B1987
MINGKKVIALIPARGGSKSIPKKNIANLGGKPLIAWSIEAALKVTEIDKVLVSTDSEDIANVSKLYGAEVSIRDKELAKDDSLVIDTIKEVLKEQKEEGFTYLVLLEPTAPLRGVMDIRECLTLISSDEYDSVATFKEAELNPHRAWKIDNQMPTVFIEGANPWLPRQKLPKAYQLNGAVYVVKTSMIEDVNTNSVCCGRVGAVVMPRERSVDIDNKIDLLLAEAVLNEGR